MKKVVKDIIDVFKNIAKTPRGRGILFFAFYFFFFLALAIYFRTMDVSRPIEKEDNTNANYISVSSKNENNYSYIYTIAIDDNYYTFDGIKNNKQELLSFTMDSKIAEYYKEGQTYYVEHDGTWTVTTIPNVNLAIIDNIDEILKNSTYIYKTEYESGKTIFNYQVGNNVIREILAGESDIEELNNDIYVTVNEDRVDSVELKLNNYCISASKCLDSMSITMDYRNFGEQKEIISPIH